MEDSYLNTTEEEYNKAENFFKCMNACLGWNTFPELCDGEKKLSLLNSLSQGELLNEFHGYLYGEHFPFCSWVFHSCSFITSLSWITTDQDSEEAENSKAASGFQSMIPFFSKEKVSKQDHFCKTGHRFVPTLPIKVVTPRRFQYESTNYIDPPFLNPQRISLLEKIRENLKESRNKFTPGNNSDLRTKLLFEELINNSNQEIRDVIPMLNILLLCYSLQSDAYDLDPCAFQFIRRAGSSTKNNLKCHIVPINDSPPIMKMCAISSESFDRLINTMSYIGYFKLKSNIFTSDKMDTDWIVIPVLRNLSLNQLLCLAIAHVNSCSWNGRINWTYDLPYVSFDGEKYETNKIVKQTIIPLSASVHISGPKNVMFVLMDTCRFLQVGNTELEVYNDFHNEKSYNWDEKYTYDLWKAWDEYFHTENIDNILKDMFFVFECLSDLSVLKASNMALGMAAELSSASRQCMFARPKDTKKWEYDNKLENAYAFGGGLLTENCAHCNKFRTFWECKDIFLDITDIEEKIMGFNFMSVSPNQLPYSSVISTASEVISDGTFKSPFFLVKWNHHTPKAYISQYEIPIASSKIRYLIFHTKRDIFEENNIPLFHSIDALQGCIYKIGAAQAGSLLNFLSEINVSLREWQGWGKVEDYHSSTNKKINIYGLVAGISSGIFVRVDSLEFYKKYSDNVKNPNILNCIQNFAGLDPRSREWAIFSGVPLWFWYGWGCKMGRDISINLAPSITCVDDCYYKGYKIDISNNAVAPLVASSVNCNANLPISIAALIDTNKSLLNHSFEQWAYLSTRCKRKNAHLNILSSNSFHIFIHKSAAISVFTLNDQFKHFFVLDDFPRSSEDFLFNLKEMLEVAAKKSCEIM